MKLLYVQEIDRAMDYWKSKVLPKIKTVFAKSAGKKAATAAELVKSFDETKEGVNGEFEEKKADLQPKVVEIYEATPAPIKVLIKERKVSGIKKNSAAVTKFIEDLANIEFPGAKQVSEGIAKVGPSLLSRPVFATFEKVTTLLPAAEETPKENSAAAEEKKEEAAEKKEEATDSEKKEEAEEKKEVEAPAAAAEEVDAGESAPAVAAAESAAVEGAAPAAEGAAEAATLAEPEPAKAEEETAKA